MKKWPACVSRVARPACIKWFEVCYHPAKIFSLFLGKPIKETIKRHIGGIVTTRRTERGAITISHPWRVGGSLVVVYGEDYA
jgi:hypothetical protein